MEDAFQTSGNSPTPWLTSEEAAQYIKVNPRTLLAWARQGKVKAFALSGTHRHIWRFKQDDLDATMAAPVVPFSETGRTQ